MASEDRLQRSLNSLERRNMLARRHDDTAPVDDLVDEVVKDLGHEPVETTGPRRADGDAAASEGVGRPTTDGMPPRIPGAAKRPGIHADHLAVTVAAMRKLASTRPGFDIVVLDPSTEPLNGTRITALLGNAPRVVPVAIEVDANGTAHPVSQDDSASELAAMLRRRER